MTTYIPAGYRSLLSVYDTQMAIGLLHRLFPIGHKVAAAAGHLHIAADLIRNARRVFHARIVGREDHLI